MFKGGRINNGDKNTDNYGDGLKTTSGKTRKDWKDPTHRIYRSRHKGTTNKIARGDIDV